MKYKKYLAMVMAGAMVTSMAPMTAMAEKAVTEPAPVVADAEPEATPVAEDEGEEEEPAEKTPLEKATEAKVAFVEAYDAETGEVDAGTLYSAVVAFLSVQNEEGAAD